MKHLKTRIFKFSGGGPPDPPNLAALLTCIFIFPASRRGHHAGRVCHLCLDFVSQPLQRLLYPGLWSLGASGTPSYFSECIARDGHDPQEGLRTFQAFFQKSILIPDTTPRQLEYATQKRTITDMHELWKLNCQSLWSSEITTHLYVLNLDHKLSILCLSKEMFIILGAP